MLFSLLFELMTEGAASAFAKKHGKSKRKKHPPVLILTDLTARGNNRLAIEVAKGLDGEFISAAPMQVYRGMNIGTGKIRVEETDGIPHFMIDILDPTEPFSAEQFKELAGKLILEILERGHLPIVSGGTGEYIQALLTDSVYNSRLFVLKDEKEKTYSEIRQQVDRMFSDGLVEEVKSLVQQGLTRDHSSMQCIGYREVLDYLEGRCDYDTAVKNVMLDTRDLVKSQIEAFRDSKEVIWLDRSALKDDDILECEINRFAEGLF